jgi:hypothetical protein
MRENSLQKVVIVLLLIMLVPISGCSSGGPSDGEASRLVSEDLNWDYYEAEITVLGKEYCGSRTGDQAKGITERWLVVYRVENYPTGPYEAQTLLIKKDGVWQVERKTWWGPYCPPP